MNSKKTDNRPDSEIWADEIVKRHESLRKDEGEMDETSKTANNKL